MKHFTFILLLSFTLSHCTIDDFGDTNVNPNNTEVPVTSALLTRVMSSMGWDHLTLEAGLYTQFFSETQYTTASRYQDLGQDFAYLYTGSLEDLQNIIRQNTNETTAARVAIDGSNNNQIAVARILKVFYFAAITDKWGDIPYSEALDGLPTPGYDAQEEIYHALFEELQSAIDQFDDGPALKGDIIYFGNIRSWKKLANSLRLTLALQLSEADEGKARSEFNAALTHSAGLMEKMEDELTLHFPGGPFKNPWFSIYDGRQDFSISDVMVRHLKSLNDPRLSVYGSSASDGNVFGVPYGLERDSATAFTNVAPDWGRILQPEFRTESSPLDLFTTAEVYFARAEAAHRNWTNESVEEMYHLAIQSSLENWGVYDPDTFEEYMDQEEVSLSTGDKLRKIATQRWIAVYPDGLCAWNSWRRTGYPVLQPTPFAVNVSKQIPVRFTYPNNEYNLNEEQLNAAVARLPEGDTQDSKLWWDQ